MHIEASNTLTACYDLHFSLTLSLLDTRFFSTQPQCCLIFYELSFKCCVGVA